MLRLKIRQRYDWNSANIRIEKTPIVRKNMVIFPEAVYNIYIRISGSEEM